MSSKNDSTHFLFSAKSTAEKSKSASASDVADVSKDLTGLKIDVTELSSLAEAKKIRGYVKDLLISTMPNASI